MSNRHDYRYDLRVLNADPEILLHFAAHLADCRLGKYLSQDPEEPSLFSTEVAEGCGSLYEDTIEQELYLLAKHFPTLKLNFVAEDLDDRSRGFELVLQGEWYQRSDLIATWTEMTPPVSFIQRKEAIRTEADRNLAVQSMLDNICKQTDFDLLYAQKNALLQAVWEGKLAPKSALEGLINFLDHMTDLGEALGRFQYDCQEPAFPMRPDYKKRTVVFPPAEKPKTHLLCEEYEGNDGIREFRILGISKSEDGLRELMQAKIEKDEHGFVAKNGIQTSGPNRFCTHFDDGFVEYYILEEEELSKEQLQELVLDERKEGSQSPGFSVNQENQLDKKPSLAEQITGATQRADVGSKDDVTKQPER